jgi:hypothetical protein
MANNFRPSPAPPAGGEMGNGAMNNIVTVMKIAMIITTRRDRDSYQLVWPVDSDLM